MTKMEIVVHLLVLLMSMDSFHIMKTTISITGSLSLLSLLFRTNERHIGKLSFLLSSFSFIIAIVRYLHTVVLLFSIYDIDINGWMVICGMVSSWDLFWFVGDCTVLEFCFVLQANNFFP